MHGKQKTKDTTKKRPWSIIFREIVIVGTTGLIISIAFCFLIALMIGSCDTVNKSLGLKSDNMMEENIENVIEHSTGIIVDLTSSSPEK